MKIVSYFFEPQPEQSRKEELERVKREQWENERKKNSNILIPKFYGCIWDDDKNVELGKYKMIPLVTLPISLEKEKDKPDDEQPSKKLPKSSATEGTSSYLF